MDKDEAKARAMAILYHWTDKRSKEYKEQFPHYSDNRCFDMAIEDTLANLRWLKRNSPTGGFMNG